MSRLLRLIFTMLYAVSDRKIQLDGLAWACYNEGVVMWPAPPQRIANHSHLRYASGMRMVLICVRVRNDNANNSHLQARLGCCVKTTGVGPIYGGLGSEVRKKSFKINDLQQGCTPAAPVQKLKCKISQALRQCAVKCKFSRVSRNCQRPVEILSCAEEPNAL